MANQPFEKRVFFEMGGELHDFHIPDATACYDSGDDILISDARGNEHFFSKKYVVAVIGGSLNVEYK